MGLEGYLHRHEHVLQDKLMGRTSILLRSKFNWLLGKVENHAEQLEFAYEQMLRDFRSAQLGLRDVVAVKHQLIGQRQTMIQSIAQLEEKAEQAMEAGRPDLARSTVERKVMMESRLSRQDSRIADLDNEQNRLQNGVRVLSVRVEEMRDLKQEMKAQLRSADAQARIAAAVTGIGSSSNDAARIIERARDQIEQRKAEASAVDELVANGTFTDILNPNGYVDRELTQLHVHDQIEREMTRLAELTPAEPKKEVTSGNN